MTDLPPDPAGSADERTTLIQFLDYYRAVFARKVEGVAEEDARRAPCPPSELSLLGLTRHLADVERGWFGRGIAGRDAPPIHYTDADPDGDLHPPPDATMDDALATWRAEVDAARRVTAQAPPLDALDTRRPLSVRWILVHMIEEYARHCGHADLIRQAIDGSVGD